MERRRTSLNREDCIARLVQMYEHLNGERFPKKSDFSEEEVSYIKAHLGPWPRALEEAGIKQRDPEAEQKKLEKRIEQKRRRTELKRSKL